MALYACDSIWSVSYNEMPSTSHLFRSLFSFCRNNFYYRTLTQKLSKSRYSLRFYKTATERVISNFTDELVIRGIRKSENHAKREVEKCFISAIGGGSNTPNMSQSLLLGKLETLKGEFEEFIHGNYFGPRRGIYVWGGVGQGKTVAMDALFDAINLENNKYTLRIHFHKFMADIHRDLHISRKNGIKNSVKHVATEITKKRGIMLLGLDEFQIIHITDAMIIKPLFEHLMQNGCTIVITSNRAPEDLYWGGLNRNLFLPFIDLLEERCEVYQLKSGKDYRLQKLRTEKGVYNNPSRSQDDIRKHLIYLANTDATFPSILNVMMGRELRVKMSVEGIAAISFSELCESPLGSADYLALSAKYHTLLLYDIPSLQDQLESNPDAVRRFVTLIDILYENKSRLILDAHVPLEEMFFSDSILSIYKYFVSALKSNNITLNDLPQQFMRFNRLDSVSTFSDALGKITAMNSDLWESLAASVWREEYQHNPSLLLEEFVTSLRLVENRDVAIMTAEEIKLRREEFVVQCQSKSVQQDNSFAIIRTASRIYHMLSSDYLLEHQQHHGLNDMQLLGYVD